MKEACSLKPLPFFFRKIDPLDAYLISNQAGSFALLDDYEQLEGVVSGNISSLHKGKQAELVAKSFVSEGGEYDLRLNLLGSKYVTLLSQNILPPALFLIVPTLRCDHDCRYCQVSRVPASKDGFDLQLENIQKILSIIEKIPNTDVKIEFQGGEPLLYFSFIKEFVDSAEYVLKDKSVSFVICTALGPLNDELLEWAKDYDVVFSISLDGPRDIHNENRPSRGLDSHNNSVKNIKKIQSSLGMNKVGALATITKKSLNFPREIVSEYYDLGFERVFLRCLSPFGFASQTLSRIGYKAEEFFAFYKKALDHVIKLNEKRIFVEETALIHLKKIFQVGCSSFADLKSPSGYLLGALVFNYDGKIFGSDESRMLWESTKAPELVLGNVNDGLSSLFINDHVNTLISDTFIDSTPGCEECAYQPYCGADPLFHLATQGDHIGDKSQSFFCRLERMIFDHLFTLYETSPKAKSVFKKWLTL